MGKSKILGSGAGNVVNGIIEQYYAATDDVKANTFVEYVEKFELTAPSAGNQIATSNLCVTVSAVKLTDSKVFIAYNKKSGYYYNVYGVVCTIENGIISAGTPVVIDNTETVPHSAQYIVAMALTSTKIAIAYSNDRSETLTSAWSVICTISGKSISVGTKKELTSSIRYWGNIRAAKLSDSSFIVVCQTENYYIYSAVCTVSGTTITMGTAAQISDSSKGTKPLFDITGLSSSKALLALDQYGSTSTSSYYSAYVMILSINGTSITVGTGYKTDSYAMSAPVTVKALSETKAIVAFQTTYEYFQICTISGTTVSLSSKVYSGNSNYMGWLEVLDESTLVFYYPSSDNSFAKLISISDTTITISATTTSFAKPYGRSNDYSCIALAQYISGMLLFVYGMPGDGNIGAQLSEVLDYKGIIPLTASAKFLGLTMTKATKTSQGKVWTLKGE